MDREAIAERLMDEDTDIRNTMINACEDLAQRLESYGVGPIETRAIIADLLYYAGELEDIDIQMPLLDGYYLAGVKRKDFS